MSRFDWYFPPTAPRPKPVHGKERKKFGMTWWGKKWVECVEEIGTDNRMSRGRAYARAERASGIDVKCGKVTARVEGSYGNYNVSIKFTKLNSHKKDSILKKIATDNSIVGSILNNELPENFENACGISVIPKDFDAECSCPDYANPCKHIASVFYILADEIDRAPQILFYLQGIGKDDILNAISGVQAVTGDQPPDGKYSLKGSEEDNQMNIDTGKETISEKMISNQPILPSIAVTYAKAVLNKKDVKKQNTKRSDISNPVKPSIKRSDISNPVKSSIKRLDISKPISPKQIFKHPISRTAKNKSSKISKDKKRLISKKIGGRKQTSKKSIVPALNNRIKIVSADEYKNGKDHTKINSRSRHKNVVG